MQEMILIYSLLTFTISLVSSYLIFVTHTHARTHTHTWTCSTDTLTDRGVEHDGLAQTVVKLDNRPAASFQGDRVICGESRRRHVANQCVHTV